MLAGIAGAVGGCGDVDNAEVDAEEAVRSNWGRLGNLASGVQVELAVPDYEVRFALAIGEQLALLLAYGEPNALEAAGDRPDADGLLVGLPRQAAIVVGLGGIGAEGALGAAVQLVGVGDLLDDPTAGWADSPSARI